ncbi:DNA cytosine methyltransferase [Staphylococcus haemolyticus]|uniref:DNA cytosine methyltransferase n=1 Tax=Staphylococcus haemolyticus TaxID=1283 RepID=UPI001F0B2DE6|nr:DNA cytosine methyltransferase [Staphylococcus haemolyticus]MCH4336393.1 DNA cytosine methyltransferase [Staphylococcus haemolyticus]
MKPSVSYEYISLFSGGGIGDIGFRKAGLTPIIMCEKEKSRSDLLKLNFPKSKIINEDINNVIDEIEKETKDLLNNKELFLISATPPCQGMSKNGIGTLLKSIKEGKRPEVDDRNLLFKPALDLVYKLRPKYFFFENVDRMINQYYHDGEHKILMTDYITSKLNQMGYNGNFNLVNFADYGVPQNRLRLIGLFSRNDVASVTLPTTTHSKTGDFFHKKHISLYEAIGNLPVLDSKTKELAQSAFHPLHQTSVSRKDLYYWIENTKEGDTAFNNNTCPVCHHISEKNDVLCQKCNHLLPKPVVFKNDKYRLIKGFTSAYKRMKSDSPAATITTRSAYAGSDSNIHPTQNRVLSIYEVAILQGLNIEDYVWGPYNNKKIPPITVLRDILGEPVSPKISYLLAKNFISTFNK